MLTESDSPLDLPLRTLAAIDNAREAAKRTRQNVEVSFAPVLAGAALFGVGMGSYVLASDGAFPDWALWPMRGSALLLKLSGIVLLYSYVWTMLRTGRRGGRQSPFGDALAPRSSRWRFGFLAIIFSIVIVQQIGLHLLRGRISDDVYYGMMIWGTRLAVLGGSGFFVHRFVRSGFWEYLVFAAGILGTLGLYIFVPGSQRSTFLLPPVWIAAVSMLITVVAAVSLVGRWRRWTRDNKAAEAIDEPTSAEVGMRSGNGSTNGMLDPMIHEASRLTIVSVLNEGQWMEFGFLVSTTQLTKGNLSTHMAKLVAAGYVEELKEFVDRKPRTSYCLTGAGRKAFRSYLKTWQKLTGGRMN